MEYSIGWYLVLCKGVVSEWGNCEEGVHVHESTMWMCKIVIMHT
jgi:hypothetical protein